jgi:hypothetical protein
MRYEHLFIVCCHGKKYEERFEKDGENIREKSRKKNYRKEIKMIKCMQNSSHFICAPEST